MQVFVYGTLTEPDRAAAVLDDVTYLGPAALDWLHRVDGSYPTLAPGGQVEGRLLETDDVAALDRYEGVDSGLYVRVSLPLVDEDFPRPEDDEDSTRPGDNEDSTRPEVDGSADDGNGDDGNGDDGNGDDGNGDDGNGDDVPDETVHTYVGDPDRLDAPAEWPGEGAFAERVGSYLDAHPVSVRSLPGDDRSRPGDARSFPVDRRSGSAGPDVPDT